VEKRECEVSFETPDGIRHCVSVQASSLHEAAVLGLAAFRQVKLLGPEAAPVGSVQVRVHSEVTSSHELPVSKLMNWLESTGKNPREGAERARLRALLK
jgi:uncharacterized protein YpmS